MARARVSIELDPGGEPYAPGDVVRGRVRVFWDADVRALRVRLAFVERTASIVAVGRVAMDEQLAAGRVTDGAAFPFALPLPADALPTLEEPGLAAVRWEVRAWADVRGPDPDDVRALDVRA